MDSNKLLKLGMQQVLAEQQQELLKAEGVLLNCGKFTRQFDEIKGSKEDVARLKDLDDLIQL